MLLGEPQATQYDLHFQVAGIPVRVHPLFWVLGLILGARGGGTDLIIWIAAVFVSVLIHELGHSLMMRRFGISSHIVLHMMGGLAIPDSFGFSRGSNSRQWILICAAGPTAGFALAAVVILIILVSGGTFFFVPSFPFFWDYELAETVGDRGSPIDRLVWAMLFVNIFWGLLNLVPVYPLDGGQIARQVFMEADPWNGVAKSLWLSVGCGAGLAVLGAMQQSLFMMFMFGMMAFQSYQMIQQSGGGGFGGGFGGGGRPW